MANDSPYLQFRNISKSFPGVKALDGVSFSVREGSVHGLVGENGAGKSTLLKILSGAYAPDSGDMVLGGRPMVFRSTAEAFRNGIAVIYQELQLVPELSVAENLFLGHMPVRGGLLDRRRLREAAAAQLQTIEEGIDPATKVSRLPIAQRQMVEIAKALTRGARVLAFDEPTSSLTAREVAKLFSVIAELKRQGRSILYVSHRLDEIFEICDSATVFRDGRRIETFEDMGGVTRDVLVNRMVGRDIRDIYNYAPRQLHEPVLEASGLAGPGLSEPASFSVAGGEVLGVFGLVGAGRTELLKLLYGAVRKTGGTVRLAGEDVVIRKPADAIGRGMVLCPEDRKDEGIIPIRSVLENLNLSGRLSRGFFIFGDWEGMNAARQIERFRIKTPSPAQLAVNLSGGNQQKVILGRWLSEKVKVLLLDEPTRGIDVGAKSEIYAIMQSLARDGVGIVMVSSDLPEALGVSDRILVMRSGRIVASVDRNDATEEKLLKLALPAGPQAVAS
ncbi:MAG TPA: L-arabinose ABC transporter ATP-binding protein AraG [Candidatus Brocadiia bacterium]|nr:L-arabinose ABC transporter ATP-binding protein AraG [Candidatus Brocadiia bacterium]